MRFGAIRTNPFRALSSGRALFLGKKEKDKKIMTKKQAIKLLRAAKDLDAKIYTGIVAPMLSTHLSRLSRAEATASLHRYVVARLISDYAHPLSGDELIAISAWASVIVSITPQTYDDLRHAIATSL